MTIISIFSLLGWLYLAVFHGRFWQPLLPAAAAPPAQWPSVDVIVPARNEANTLPESLPSLLAQDYPGAWRVIVVDDHSNDGSGDVAWRLAADKGERLTVIAAPELLPGWNGKLAALNTALAQSKAEYILFTDADIRHPPHNLRELVSAAIDSKLDLVSFMVKLHCQTFAEKLLIPAFVFFFALLYPFRRVNDPKTRVAAAAGGVMLVKRTALDKIGGLLSIKSQLIDDCALARMIKRSGGRIRLTLASDAESLRIYPAIADVWPMITRAAFTQLHHSYALLAGIAAGMGVLFLAPILLPPIGSVFVAAAGLVAWAIMTVLYLPTIRFYQLPFAWALMLPVAGIIYTAATIDSARLYWQGRGGMWKGRVGVRSQGSGIRENKKPL